MPASVLEIHPEALLEAEADLAFYAARSPGVGARLLAELERAVDLVAEAPQRWHPYVLDTRRYVLRDFPYSVVYRESAGVVTIYAFAHAKRRPGYWRTRLPGR